MNNLFHAIKKCLSHLFYKRKLNNLVNLLKNTELFNPYDDKKILAICKKSEIKRFQAHTIIIRENDIGDACYIILRGCVKVTVNTSENKKIVLARLTKGRYFGEQALLDSIKPDKRNATVITTEQTLLMKINHDLFNKILKSNRGLKSLLKSIGERQLLSRIRKQFNHYQAFLDKIENSQIGKINTYKSNTIIFHLNDKSESVYMILQGRIKLMFADNKKQIIINPGHLFGELGVLTNQPRIATAVAIEETQLLEIPKQTFLNIYSENIELQAIFTALYNTYQIPYYGAVEQYMGKYATYDALYTRFKMEDGSDVLSTRIIDKPIFNMSRTTKYLGKSEKFYFKNSENSREIIIADSQCISCSSDGRWDDLGLVCQYILEKKEISNGQIKRFVQTGSMLDETHDNKIICQCMKLSKINLIKTIKDGVNNYSTLSKITGAGSICGCCEFRIKQLLGSNQFLNVKIDSIQEHHEMTRSFRLKPTDGILPSFKPGQHIILQTFVYDKIIERSYTLSYYENFPDTYTITIKRDPNGIFSNWLFHLSEVSNQILRISVPMGNFILDTSLSRPAICFVAGIGITPIMAFATAIDKTNSQRKIHIHYSAHTETDFVFLEELKQFVSHHPNVSLQLKTTISEGRLNKNEILNIVSKEPTADIYICGPKGYNQLLVKSLQDLTTHKIYIEDFYPI